MPASLYPRNKKVALATRTHVIGNPEHVKVPLLCGECEGRFSRNGEDEVLRWLAPKARLGKSPLHQALKTAVPRWDAPGVTCYESAAVGIDPERFAYFVLSLVWRAAACDWPVVGANRIIQRLDLGEFYKPLRQYLLGNTPFPSGTLVTLSVATDEKSREFWAPPTRTSEHSELIGVVVMGLLFRVWFGPDAPRPILNTLFFPATGNPIYCAEAWDHLSPAFSELFPDTSATDPI